MRHKQRVGTHSISDSIFAMLSLIFGNITNPGKPHSAVESGLEPGTQLVGKTPFSDQPSSKEFANDWADSKSTLGSSPC